MSEEYNKYLDEHVNGLKQGLKWFEKYYPKVFINEKTGNDIQYLVETNVILHDKSKYSIEEYYAYDEYFYGDRNNEKEFNYAWLHHQNHNPHHWQYWLLVNDDEGKLEALDIPLEYIIEMILDWWSFSWKQGNLFEIFKWYDNNKNNMILSDKTRTKVENILEIMQQLLYGNTTFS